MARTGQWQSGAAGNLNPARRGPAQWQRAAGGRRQRGLRLRCGGRAGGAACGPEEPAVVACGRGAERGRRVQPCHTGRGFAAVGPAGISLPVELSGVPCRCLLLVKGVGVG